MEEVIIREEMQEGQKKRLGYLSDKIGELVKGNDKPDDSTGAPSESESDVMTGKEGEINE